MMELSEASFNNREFENLKFDIINQGSGTDLLKAFPELSDLPFFHLPNKPRYIEKVKPPEYGAPTEYIHHELDRDQVFRYICFCYDAESPIWNKFMDNEKKRKTWAAYYAGWRADKEGNFPFAVVQMMDCRIPEVNDLIVDFIKLFNDPDFAYIAISYESLFSSMRVISKSSEDAMNEDGAKNLFDVEKSRGAIQGLVEKSLDSLKTRVAKYLRDNNPNLRKSFFNVVNLANKMRLKITPERQLGIEKVGEDV